MKSIIAGLGLFGVLSVIGCAGPAPPAPFETTRAVPVTQRVESITEVEVTREVPVTVPVEVTREVPITRLVTPVPQAGDQSGKPRDEVELRIIAINDFHGHIATSSDSFGGVGRADYLAANVAAARANAQNSVFVSAGDLIGASPLISALFHDEPTIEAMNLIGLEINAVGNHEFDEGLAELQRMQHGGPHPVDADPDGNPFAGADFQFLAANVIDETTGRVIFPAYAVRDYQGISVAFIGMTLEGTPSIVTRSGVAGLTFRDEAETVNALVRDLQEGGIESIIVLLHEGGSSDGGQNDCGNRPHRAGGRGGRKVGRCGGFGDRRPHQRRVRLRDRRQMAHHGRHSRSAVHHDRRSPRSRQQGFDGSVNREPPQLTSRSDAGCGSNRSHRAVRSFWRRPVPMPWSAP